MSGFSPGPHGWATSRVVIPQGLRLVLRLRKVACATCGNGIVSFKDTLSYTEFTISGMCQACQDSTFKPRHEDDTEDRQAEQDALAGASAAEDEARAREEALNDRERAQAEEADAYVEPPDEPNPYAGDNTGDPP